MSRLAGNSSKAITISDSHHNKSVNLVDGRRVTTKTRSGGFFLIHSAVIYS